MNQLPPPEAFGLPPKFDRWRPDQERAILSITNPPSRFIINIKPTGGGKSLDYITAAIIGGKRTAILTSTKGLQQQLYNDFGSQPGAVLVMGKNEYRCRMFPISCEYGPCRFGLSCSYKRCGCPYYDNLTTARKANIIITNYAFWFSHQKLFEAIGPIDFLVCDEAHDTIPNMLDNMSINISDWVCKNTLKQEFIKKDHTDKEYWDWAKNISAIVYSYIEDIKDDKELLHQHINDKRFQALCDFNQRIAQPILSADPTKWVVEHVGDKVTFDPTWPAEFVEDMLFKGVPRILLTSATINSEMLEYLDIDNKDITVNEFDSYFPKERHPVTYIPTVRVYGDYRMSDRDYRVLLSRIDNIIKPRLDRNGIIHSVSYTRGKNIYSQSEYADNMIIHNNKDRAEMIQYFKDCKDKPPAILISPSVTTGYDFPGKECEYQIVVKLPFPDTRRKVDKIRREINPDYYNNMTMITLEQSVGRGWRSEKDQCETFIIDDNWIWFRKMKRGSGRFMHKWFRRLLKESNIIPKPLKKL